MVDGEPLSAAAEARHHLVGDEDDAIPVAQLAHARQIARRRHHDACGARDGLQHDRGDRRRSLEADHVFEVRECSLGLLGLGGRVEMRAVEERAEEVHDAAVAVVVGPAPRVTGQVDRGVRAAVVRAVPAQHLVPAGMQTRHAERVLVGVGTAVGEEDLVQLAGGALRDQSRGLGAGVVRVLGSDRAQRGGLGLDGCHHTRVLVTDVGVDQLRGEVQQAISVAVPDVRAARRDDRHRCDLGLGRPRMEHVRPVEFVRSGSAIPGLVDGEAVGQQFGFGGQCHGGVSHLFSGKPRLMPPWLGSSQRWVMALPRVKNCTPSVPWAWASPNREAFQPPKL